jgi:hypothetical protein
MVPGTATDYFPPTLPSASLHIGKITVDRKRQKQRTKDFESSHALQSIRKSIEKGLGMSLSAKVLA